MRALIRRVMLSYVAYDSMTVKAYRVVRHSAGASERPVCHGSVEALSPERQTREHPRALCRLRVSQPQLTARLVYRWPTFTRQMQHAVEVVPASIPPRSRTPILNLKFQPERPPSNLRYGTPAPTLGLDLL